MPCLLVFLQGNFYLAFFFGICVVNLDFHLVAVLVLLELVVDIGK